MFVFCFCVLRGQFEPLRTTAVSSFLGTVIGTIVILWAIQQIGMDSGIRTVTEGMSTIVLPPSLVESLVAVVPVATMKRSLVQVRQCK